MYMCVCVCGWVGGCIYIHISGWLLYSFPVYTRILLKCTHDLWTLLKRCVFVKNKKPTTTKILLTSERHYVHFKNTNYAYLHIFPHSGKFKDLDEDFLLICNIYVKWILNLKKKTQWQNLGLSLCPIRRGKGSK